MSTKLQKSIGWPTYLITQIGHIYCCGRNSKEQASSYASTTFDSRKTTQPPPNYVRIGLIQICIIRPLFAGTTIQVDHLLFCVGWKDGRQSTRGKLLQLYYLSLLQHPLDRRRLRRSVQPARSNMPNFLQEDSAPQNPEHSNTWRLTNMTRHYYNQINDFRMGNWDRSERILDSLINGLRIQKANLDSKNAIMPLDWAPDTRQNSDTRSERTQEVLNLSDYWKQVRSYLYLVWLLGFRLKNFRHRWRNSGSVSTWIASKQKQTAELR